MAKLNIGFDSWPFEKGERAKLIKISKPFSENGLWYITAVYLSIKTNKPKFQKHFCGDLHLLIVEAEYIDGIRQDMPKWETVDISLPANLISNKNFAARLIEDKKYHEFDYYTYGINVKQEYYIVPLIEIVRAILAPDVFWLNQITQLDSIDTRVLCNRIGKTMHLNFTADVPVRYVRMDTKIKHAAWLFSNPMIYNMIAHLYHNIRSGNGILFEFLFKKFAFTARIEKWNGRNYVREIIACKRKKINCSEVIVHHPGLVEYDEHDAGSEDGGQHRKRMSEDSFAGNKMLVSNLTALSNTIDIERDDTIHSEYASFVKIKRIRVARGIGTSAKAQVISDELGETNNRTTADYGGLDTVPQIEFEHSISEKLEGEFADMYAILGLMAEQPEVVSVKYHIGKLNDHFRFRSICTLEDRITPRQYFIGIIKLKDGREAMLVEIQREKISLTTLLIVSLSATKWNYICHKIIKGLIEKSGTWPDFEGFGFKSLEVNRFKHTHIEITKREKRIFESVLN